VYEVDLDYNVIHIKSLDIPESSPKKDKDKAGITEDDHLDVTAEVAPAPETTAMEGIEDHSDMASRKTDEPSETTPSASVEPSREKGKSKEKKSQPDEPWPDRFTVAFAPFLSKEAVTQMKTMFLEGPEPPRVSDSGWGGRPARPADTDMAESSNAPEPPEEDKGRRGKDRGGRSGRGGRGGKSGGRGGRAGRREDTRKVLSDVRFFILCLLICINNNLMASNMNSPSRTRRLGPPYIRL